MIGTRKQTARLWTSLHGQGVRWRCASLLGIVWTRRFQDRKAAVPRGSMTIRSFVSLEVPGLHVIMTE